MFFYFIFPIILYLLAFIGIKHLNVGKLSIFLMLFFSIFRGDLVGVDTANYMNEMSIQYWGDSYDLSEWTNTEFIFIFLNKVVYQLGLSPRVIISFYSVLTMLFLYLSLKRFKVNIAAGATFFVLLLLYYQSFNAARQIASVSVLMYASSFLFCKGYDKYKFFLYVFLASLLHTSSIFGLVFFFFEKMSFNRRSIVFLVTCFYIIGLLFPYFDVVTKVLSLFGDNFRYAKYGIGSDYEQMSLSLLGMLFKLIQFALMMYVFMRRNNGKKTDLLDNMYIASFVIMSLFNYSDQVSHRFIYEFIFIQCIYIPMCLFNREVKRNNTDIVVNTMLFVTLLFDSYLFSYNLGDKGYYMNFNIL